MTYTSNPLSNPPKLGLWIVDVQEKLFPHIAPSKAMLDSLIFTLRAFQLWNFPILCTEQYPQGLGPTLPEIKKCFSPEQKIYPKTTFSGYDDGVIRQAIEKEAVEEWVIVGIETHICILQSAKALMQAGKKVTLLQDATGASSLEKAQIALRELERVGARVTSSETIVYEILHDSHNPHFKTILSLMKEKCVT
jgi:hypothetical protein